MELEFERAELSVHDLSEAAQDRLARILDEYLVAVERGEPITPDELLRRHPQDARHLRGYLSGLQVFHTAAAELKPVQAPFAGRLHPAQVIGDFRLVREIGRGGMGVVFEAWQISLQRRVALKVLPFTSAHDDKQIHRFRNEALAAAHVEHANIVPVHAVGEDSGVHYYAMQLIEGQSLASMLAEIQPPHANSVAATTAANRQATTWGNPQSAKPASIPSRPPGRAPNLPIQNASGRVRMITRFGIQAAEALHAAHETGIVHRDVKPSNLLVDAQGKLWVTDFGLARFREHAGLTRSGDVLGTMRYMSPEQALGRGGLIDHRTDVYSLGVTLYELATGHHPSGDLANAMLVPSATAFYQKAMRCWNPNIPRDFETVVMKAIAEFPHERFATAQEFADDLRRFLEGRPIHASRPSLVNRAGKWARRHRAFVSAAAAVLVLALVGQSINALLLAQKNRDVAQALAAEKERVKERGLVLDRFSTQLVDQLEAIPGAEGVRYQLLEDSLGLYQRFEAQAAGDPALATDLALAYGKMGTLSEKMGKRSEALPQHVAARDLWQKRVAAEPSHHDYSLNLALSHNNVALLLAESGRYDDAVESFHSAQHLLQKLNAAEPTQAAAAALATTYGNLGLVLQKRGELMAAAELFRNAISIHNATLSNSPDSEATLRALAACYNNLASLEDGTAQKVAIESYRKAIDIQCRLVKKSPTNRLYQGDLARTYNNLGFVLIGQQDFHQGQVSYRNAVAIQENLVKASPFAACYRRDLAISYNNLGMAESRFEHFPEAEDSFRRAIQLQKSIHDAQPDDAKSLSDMGGMYNNLALLLDRLKRFGDADTAYKQAIRFQRMALEAAPGESQYRGLLQNHYANYAKSLRTQNKQQEAERLTQEGKSLLAGTR